MSTTAYKQVDLAYNDNIDIKPPVVAARIKQVYEKTLIGTAAGKIKKAGAGVAGFGKVWIGGGANSTIEVLV